MDWLLSQDLREFPEDVRQVMGFALYMAQSGGKHIAAKPLRGYGGAGVLEVVDDFDTRNARLRGREIRDDRPRHRS